MTGIRSAGVFRGAVILCCTIFCALICTAQSVSGQVAEEKSARAEDLTMAARAAAVYSATGVRGGLVVHLGCGDGSLTAALRANDRYQVHGLERDPERVAALRRRLILDGTYGPVTVDRWEGNSLPLVDNLVNLLVAEDLAGVAMNEVLRVLVPRGVAYVKQDGQWTKTVKPRPTAIDEWTHFLYDASGNPVAHDTVVGPPEHLQWVGSPRWSRHHDRMASMSALVSAGGRVFYIMDEGSRVSIQMPPKWTLVARDAFNGVVLWKRPIERWHHHLWPLKSGPTQLARRLIARGERVYVALGIDAPLSELDAATGETLRTYEDTAAAEEVLLVEDTLIVLANPGESELAAYAPQLNVGDQRRVGDEFQWNGKPRRLMAFQAESGEPMWSHESPVAPLSPSADRERLYFHDGVKIVGLRLSDGRPAWTSDPVGRISRINFNSGPRIVVQEGVLLFTGGDRTVRAFEAETGKPIWSAPHARGGYQSPEDLLVVGGLVWSAPTTSGRDTGVFTGRDLRTGEVKQEFPPDVETYWFHHRCHIAKATDRFLLPSRTGIEFVDPKQQHWKIHHWVRGGCLYGIMPCNGLVYAPPHNCACYPEAKLFGLNALAPAATTRQLPDEISDKGRLEQGPVYDQPIHDQPVSGTPRTGDWPTYRGDNQRSGFQPQAVPAELERAWMTRLDGDGRLTAPVVAEGCVYVAQVDQHMVSCLSAETGTAVWQFVAGGRVDSPPTVADGRVVFGSADGWVYCLRASDGKLIWRFRAAPEDRRLMAFEQLESVWPVSGSVLVRDGQAWFVAGRSCFLDGGLRLFRLDLASGRKLAERVIDDRDPETGEDLQERLEVLQMPVGLPDVLSSAGDSLYMRSQRFDLEGNRIELGPHSGQAAQQGAVQRGEQAHLFSPTGFLDDTYFHRSYWVYGRSFAGGHNGYYQAGKFAPSGRMLVFDQQKEKVFGFGRKPQYYRWTTTLEHQLFAADATAPEPGSPGGGPSMVRVARSPSLNPTGKALAVEAWVQAERPEGVVLARGGPAVGYALAVRGGKPRFVVRAGEKVQAAVGPRRIVGRWTHLVGVLTEDKQLQLFVDGQRVATQPAESLLLSDPAQALEIGADDKGAVGDYRSPLSFTGLIDEVRVYHGTVKPEEIAARAARPQTAAGNDERLVLAFSFDDGKARDASGHENHGQAANVQPAEGKLGSALRFRGGASQRGGANQRGGGTLVQHDWTRDLPLLVRAMVLADEHLFVAGPPDLIDEEESFQRLASRDPKIAEQLARQDEALKGAEGGMLEVVSTADGQPLGRYPLDSLPVWDGLAAAQGRLYLVTQDGQVVCYRAKNK